MRPLPPALNLILSLPNCRRGSYDVDIEPGRRRSGLSHAILAAETQIRPSVRALSSDDRPCAETFDARRVRITPRGRRYIAQSHHIGPASGKAAGAWLRRRDPQGLGRHRRWSDPDHRE
jgi:hypothetical protein